MYFRLANMRRIAFLLQNSAVQKKSSSLVAKHQGKRKTRGRIHRDCQALDRSKTTDIFKTVDESVLAPTHVSYLVVAGEGNLDDIEPESKTRFCSGDKVDWPRVHILQNVKNVEK